MIINQPYDCAALYEQHLMPQDLYCAFIEQARGTFDIDGIGWEEDTLYVYGERPTRTRNTRDTRKSPLLPDDDETLADILMTYLEAVTETNGFPPVPVLRIKLLPTDAYRTNGCCEWKELPQDLLRAFQRLSPYRIGDEHRIDGDALVVDMDYLDIMDFQDDSHAGAEAEDEMLEKLYEAADRLGYPKPPITSIEVHGWDDIPLFFFDW